MQEKYYDGSLDQSEAASVEQTFFTRVYTWMTAALVMTAVVALFMYKTGMVFSLLRIGVLGGYPVAFLLILIGELILVGKLVANVKSLSRSAAIGLFLFYAALNGVTLSVIFLIYTGTSIASTFFITAGTFGAMSLYGYMTKRSLASIGGYLTMGLVGIIIASVVNWFLKSPALYWIITYGGIAVFLGLTAFDTQKLKSIAHSGEVDDPGSATTEKLAIYGALQLYLDFINLFLLFLRLFGRRK